MNSFEEIKSLKQKQQIVLKYSFQKQKETNFKITTSVIEFKQSLNKIEDDFKRLFIPDLLIGAIINWEALDRIGKRPSFQQSKTINLKFLQDLIIRISKQNNLQIKIYEFQEEIDKARQIILQNLAFFEMVAQRDISAQMINMFFTQHTFYSYYQVNSQNLPELIGLSSYTGQRTYVNLADSSVYGRIETLIHEFGHNISRFGANPINVRKISPERNTNLRMEDQLIEPRNWIEVMLFKKAIKTYDPFSQLIYPPNIGDTN